MATTYIIRDWADNHLFKDKEFNTPEEGIDFLMGKFEYDEDLQEYFVVPKNK